MRMAFLPKGPREARIHTALVAPELFAHASLCAHADREKLQRIIEQATKASEGFGSAIDTTDASPQVDGDARGHSQNCLLSHSFRG